MEDSMVFFYILVVVALILKGVINIVWKKATRNIPQNPPIDATQLPNETTTHLPNSVERSAQQQATEPVVLFNEGERILPDEPAILEGKATLQEKPLTMMNDDAAPMVTIRNVEDLRKAVIYSEILNRKY